MLDKSLILKKLEQNKEKIRSFGVRSLILIGSFAGQSASNKSDIDFLIEFEKGRGLFDDYIHLHQFLEDVLKRDIDLVEKSLIREELRSSILGGPQVEARI